jgi:prolyl oligopeptidase
MPPPAAPPATRREDLVETVHGIEVADPYRWLEDQGAPEVAEWVAAQAAHARAWLDRLPNRAAIRAELEAVWDHPEVGVPWRRGRRWFQHRNAGLQEQPVLWTADSPTAEGRPLLDPAELSPDGTVAVVGTAVSRDGGRLAYGTSDGGSDWVTWHVRDVATGVDTGDTAAWGKFSGAAWTADGRAFFYGGYEPPAEGRALAERNAHHRLRLLRLGEPEPVLVHADPAHPRRGFSPEVTEDGRWLVVTVWEGTEPRTRIHLGDLAAAPDPAAVEIRPWLDDFDAEYDVLGADGDTLYVTTDLDAPNGRVLAIDAHDPTRRREVLPESDHALLSARLAGLGQPGGGRLVAVHLVDAVHRLSVHDLRAGPDRRTPAGPLGTVELPDLSSVGDLTGLPDDEALHLSLSSFAASPSTHRLDVRTLQLELVRPAAVAVPEVVTEQVLVDSTDGARVPLFLVHDADVAPGSGARVLLYGYGGFNIALTPAFRLWWSAWLRRGGVIAVGCYRGGGEYGRRWHDDGRLAQKRHTIDDALACARWLVAQGWARPADLAITGASNGGLTAAAAMLAAPELFGACVPEVGVLDLLRFHRFTIGWGWVSDYGDPDDPADVPLLHELSPYHTALRAPAAYPATLITTADHDDRVVPAHSYKFAAALQAAQTGPAPVLARIDVRAGHGAGTPTSKLIDARADVIAFLEHVLPGGG